MHYVPGEGSFSDPRGGEGGGGGSDERALPLRVLLTGPFLVELCTETVQSRGATPEHLVRRRGRREGSGHRIEPNGASTGLIEPALAPPEETESEQCAPTTPPPPSFSSVREIIAAENDGVPPLVATSARVPRRACDGQVGRCPRPSAQCPRARKGIMLLATQPRHGRTDTTYYVTYYATYCTTSAATKHPPVSAPSIQHSRPPPIQNPRIVLNPAAYPPGESPQPCAAPRRKHGLTTAGPPPPQRKPSHCLHSSPVIACHRRAHRTTPSSSDHTTRARPSRPTNKPHTRSSGRRAHRLWPAPAATISAKEPAPLVPAKTRPKRIGVSAPIPRRSWPDDALAQAHREPSMYRS